MIIEIAATLAFASTPSTVPTIEASDFAVGRSWTWDYVDQKGAIYSTERYEVLARQGEQVVIEMSSSYGGGGTLTPHHRMDVNVGTCLRAYSNPVRKKPWSFKMYALEAGRWVPFDPGKTLAFEEKFNCNPHVTGGVGAQYETVFTTIDDQPVFQHKLWRKLTSSWFSLTGPDRAVAVRKEFSSDPSAPYVFKRR